MQILQKGISQSPFYGQDELNCSKKEQVKGIEYQRREVSTWQSLRPIIGPNALFAKRACAVDF